MYIYVIVKSQLNFESIHVFCYFKLPAVMIIDILSAKSSTHPVIFSTSLFWYQWFIKFVKSAFSQIPNWFRISVMSMKKINFSRHSSQFHLENIQSCIWFVTSSDLLPLKISFSITPSSEKKNLKISNNNFRRSRPKRK